MPIYEYQCDKCGTFEVMQRITEAPLKRCPTCKGKVERLISRSSFVLKGTGWYATDYARSGGKAESSSSSSETKNGTHGSSSGKENVAKSGDSSKSSESASKAAETGSGEAKSAD